MSSATSYSGKKLHEDHYPAPYHEYTCFTHWSVRVSFGVALGHEDISADTMRNAKSDMSMTSSNVGMFCVVVYARFGCWWTLYGATGIPKPHAVNPHSHVVAHAGQ